MFNDDVQMGFFDVYDQYLLNILYDPRIRPGMTKREVEALIARPACEHARVGRPRECGSRGFIQGRTRLHGNPAPGDGLKTD